MIRELLTTCVHTGHYHTSWVIRSHADCRDGQTRSNEKSYKCKSYSAHLSHQSSFICIYFQPGLLMKLTNEQEMRRQTAAFISAVLALPLFITICLTMITYFPAWATMQEINCSSFAVRKRDTLHSRYKCNVPSNHDVSSRLILFHHITSHTRSHKHL